MTFSEEQMTALAQFERHFYTILNADFASNPGPAALRTLHSIMVAAVDWKEPLNSSCNHCWGRLLRSAGDLYFKQLKRNKVVRYFKTSAEAEAYIEKVSGYTYVKSASKYMRNRNNYAVQVTPRLAVFHEEEMTALLGKAKNQA